MANKKYKVKDAHKKEALHYNGFFLTEKEKEKLPASVAEAYLKSPMLSKKIEEIEEVSQKKDSAKPAENAD